MNTAPFDISEERTRKGAASDFPAVSRSLCNITEVRTSTDGNENISTKIALNVPPAVAIPALETVLEEFKRFPSQSALALNMRELHLPFEALISVPIQAHVTRVRGHGENEWAIRICAAAHPHVYPVFEGDLRLLPAGDRGCELQLAGEYRVPLGPIGRALDATLFSGIAEQSLRRFVRELANRVAALARWAHLA